MEHQRKIDVPFKADGKGLRYDSGKTRFELIPFDALRVIAEVFTKGAEKYEPRNWERGMLFSRCVGSLLRHFTAWENGEDIDAESRLPHMAHAAWNCIALLTYGLRGIGEDDRPKSAGKMSQLDTVTELLNKEFYKDDSRSSVAAVADHLCGCSGCALKRMAAAMSDVEKQNRGAADATFKAIEIYDDGVFERNAAGERVHYISEIKVGSKIVIRGRAGNYRVVADLRNGKFSVCKRLNPVLRNVKNEPLGPIEVVQFNMIQAVLWQ